MNTTTTTYPQALRALSDVIETNGLEGTTFHPDGESLGIFPANWQSKDLEKSEVRAITRALGGTWDKGTRTDPDGTTTLKQKAVLGYFSATIYFNRAATCERKVVGTEPVVHAPVPAQEGYTEMREVVEWDCGSLLSDDAPVAAVERELVSA